MVGEWLDGRSKCWHATRLAGYRMPALGGSRERYDVGFRVLQDFDRAFYEQLLVIYNIECEIGRKGSFGDLLSLSE